MSRHKVNREDVAGELWPGVSPELLKELHILTRDGDLNADSRRKLKQVKHLVQLLDPAIDDVLARFEQPLVVDCGAGKGYLGFLLYNTRLSPAGRGRLLNIEARDDLVRRASAIAEKAGMDGVGFRSGLVAEANSDEPHPHLVVALHACDTATDDAILLGLRHRAEWIAVVPCCQAEVARLLKKSDNAVVNAAAVNAAAVNAAAVNAAVVNAAVVNAAVVNAAVVNAIDELHAHPIHRREFGAHLTNVIRALTLEAQGYRVTVTELVGWEHSLKNELIIAKQIQNKNPLAQRKLDALLAATGVVPKVARPFTGG